jgi:hypothetical protein
VRSPVAQQRGEIGLGGPHRAAIHRHVRQLSDHLAKNTVASRAGVEEERHRLPLAHACRHFLQKARFADAATTAQIDDERLMLRQARNDAFVEHREHLRGSVSDQRRRLHPRQIQVWHLRADGRAAFDRDRERIERDRGA